MVAGCCLNTEVNKTLQHVCRSLFQLWNKQQSCLQAALSFILVCVCVENTPQDKKTGGQIRIINTKSGAGLEFRLLDRTAKASAKGTLLFFTDAGRLFIYVR